MNTLATDVHKSAEQLASAQKVAQTEQAFHTFFRTELGRQFASNDANRSMITNYLGDTPVSLETIAQAVGFIGSHLSPADERSQARLDQEDARVEQEKADAQRASQKALWALPKEALRAEIRRQQAVRNEPKAVVLINPLTGNEYTRRELLALNASEIKKLLLYPNHQSKPPEYKAAFDRILATELS